MGPDRFSRDELNFFAAIGYATVAWAFLEDMIDMIVDATLERNGGSTLVSEPPRALKRKLNYLHRAFSTLPTLVPLATMVLPLLDEIHKESDKRHDIVHGTSGWNLTLGALV